jgi:hypothetical protein
MKITRLELLKLSSDIKTDVFSQFILLLALRLYLLLQLTMGRGKKSVNYQVLLDHSLGCGRHLLKEVEEGQWQKGQFGREDIVYHPSYTGLGILRYLTTSTL